MKYLISISLLLCTFNSFGQKKTAEDFGFRRFQILYKGDKADILIKSKKGEENIAKPLFFYCQGSLPQPLIKTDNDKVYGVFSFKPDSLATYYHLAIVSKPGVPVIMDKKDMGDRFSYLDSAGKVTKYYSDRNLLDYYVKRNIQVIKFLQKQKWISTNKLIFAGHSEGSTIVAKMATLYPKVTNLIYSSGNPFGRIMSEIGQSRQEESDTDRLAENDFELWKSSTENPNDMDFTKGDTYKANVEFSYPPITYLEKLKIPVLVSYGTKDWCAPFNDYLRVEAIRKHKSNFSFNAYIGTEHNYFPLKNNGEINYDIFNWDKVAYDWLVWLRKN